MASGAWNGQERAGPRGEGVAEHFGITGPASSLPYILGSERVKLDEKLCCCAFPAASLV
jgi:hypothetical protein